MKFNINEFVRVRLTDHGRAVHAANHAVFWAQAGRPGIPYTPPKEDAEGWSEWQMWSLMSAFGNHMHLGCKNVFETEIEIVEKDAAK